MLLFKKRILGIDFGTRFVKIVELEKSGKSLNLVNYSITSLLWEDSTNYLLGATQLFEENLANILKEGTKDFKTKDAVFVLPASYLFSTSFSLPNMPKKSLQNMVQFEARKYLPVSSGEIAVESRVLQFQNQYQENKEQVSVFMIGIPNGLTNKLKVSADLANLNYKRGEAEFFAYEPFFKNNSVSILINIDLNYSLMLVFYTNGALVFGKKIKFKVFDIFESVSKLLGVSFNKAEEFLIEKKFNIPEELKNIKENLNSYLETAYSELQDEISGVYDKFGFKAENIFLTGSALGMPGFSEIFQKHCARLRINILDAFKNLQNVPQKSNVLSNGPIFGGAVGACLKYFKL